MTIRRLQVMQLYEYLTIIEKTQSPNVIMQKITELTGAYSVKEANDILKSWIIDLEAAEKTFEKEIKISGKSDFDIQSLVTEVSKYLGFQIDRLRTTAAEFASYVASFHHYIENQKTQDEKRKIKR